MVRVICGAALVVSLLLLCGPAFAATINAASCSQTDVASAIASASAGDTVTVPAGTCAWTSHTVTGITLIGAGKGSSGGTVITSGTVTVTKHATQNTRFSGFRMTGTDDHILITGSASNKPFRVDHVYMTLSNTMTLYVRANGGLIDHVDFYSSSATYADTIKLMLDPSEWSSSWTAAQSMGTADTNGDKNIYFEDDTWTNFNEIAFDCDNGSRAVVRHSTMTDSGFTAHGGGSGTSGNDTSSVGCRHMEFYNNAFVRVSNAAAVNKWIWWRGNGGVFANNVVPRADSPDGSSYPGKPEIVMSVGCQQGSYPIRYAVGQSTDTPDATPDYPTLIFGNTGSGTTDGDFLSIRENPNNACASPGTYIQAGRDYQTSNTWGWAPYTYPHPLQSGEALLSAPTNLRWQPR
jgi:hypothetical protein